MVQLQESSFDIQSVFSAVCGIYEAYVDSVTVTLVRSEAGTIDLARFTKSQFVKKSSVTDSPSNECN